MLDEIRIIACAAMLAIAAIIDIKSREIPDKIWVGFGAFGALLAILQFTSGPNDSILGSAHNSPQDLFTYLLGIAIVTPIGYVIYKTGLFGGADSKALIAIAVLMPTYDGMMFKLHGITALTILTNALIISMSQLFFNAARNAVAVAKGVKIFEGIEEGTARKVLAFAMGYRSSSAQGYLFPMEGIDEVTGKRKFSFNPTKFDEFVEESDSDAEEKAEKSNGIWVTQALPFIVYIAIGFVIAITVGDLFGAVMQTIVPIPKT